MVFTKNDTSKTSNKTSSTFPNILQGEWTQKPVKRLVTELQVLYLGLLYWPIIDPSCLADYEKGWLHKYDQISWF